MIIQTSFGIRNYRRGNRPNMSIKASPALLAKLGIKKGNKFHNKKTIVDGITFDSKLEANFYAGYLLPLSKKENFTIQFQKVIPIEINNHEICRYVADFFIPETQTIYETKGIYTASSKIKLRLVQALYEYKIIVVRKGNSMEEVPEYRKRTKPVKRIS